MTDQQYEQFLGDLGRLRAALGLPDGALPISPRAAFLDCVERAEVLRDLVTSCDLELHFLDQRQEIPSVRSVRTLIRDLGLTASTEDD